MRKKPMEQSISITIIWDTIDGWCKEKVTVWNFTWVCASGKQKVPKCPHICILGSDVLWRPNTTWNRLTMPPAPLGPDQRAQTPIDQSGQMPTNLTSFQRGFSPPTGSELGLPLSSGIRNSSSFITQFCQIHQRLLLLPAPTWLSFSPVTAKAPDTERLE